MGSKLRKGTAERYDAFAMAYHTNGNNGTKAAEAAGYSKKTARQMAQRLLTKPYIQDKLKSLQAEAAKNHGWSLQKRLETLQQVAEAGLTKYYSEAQGERYENLNATVSDIKTMNEMLGTGEEEEQAQPLNITFNVAPAVGDIKVTNAAT